MVWGNLLGLQLWIVVPVTVLGGLMRGFAGFGSGMLMAPILSVFYGPVNTVAIIVLLEAMATIQLIPQIRYHVTWSLVAPLALIAMIVMPLGGWLLVSLTPVLMTRTISLVALACVALIASGWKYSGRRSHIATVVVGMLSGIMMGATSLGMPPVMAYLFSGNDAVSNSRRNITAYFALILSGMLAILMMKGLLQKDALALVILLTPLYIATTWIGNVLFQKFTEVGYRRIVLGLLMFSGLYGLLR